MSANPFSDTLYRVPSDEHITNGKTLEWPTTIYIPIIKTVAPVPTSAWSPSTTSTSASPTSTAPSTPPPPTTLAWSAADLTYLLTILYPTQMSSASMSISTHFINPHDLFSPVEIEIVLHTECPPAPRSAYAPTAPIGTGRPKSRSLLAAATGATPPEARKALAHRILQDLGPEILHCVEAYYQLLADLHGLGTVALVSLCRGIEGMRGVGEEEWVGRRAQVRAAGVDGGWGVEARLEGWLLEGGCYELGPWESSLLRAAGMRRVERECRREMYGSAVGFLGVVVEEVGWC
ncbi:hypothetical protein PMIN06_007792 [Paraphaeosphaeria minitans]|uniref:Uncharacterized protein n=1 Tax=Paraphaeosphaeria minitans TaxID=565426 RepID=A0A9P6GCQ6_9PLEO|nr:hypothetical protein PMIN01_09753 [Paraphaeosphaeria minitans]